MGSVSRFASALQLCGCAVCRLYGVLSDTAMQCSHTEAGQDNRSGRSPNGNASSSRGSDNREVGG